MKSSKAQIHQNTLWTKHPLKKKDENYPTIQNTTTKQKQENTTDQNRTGEPTIISETHIIPETQTNNSSPHTPTNDAQQPELPKSNTPAPEQHKITNTQIQSSSPTLVNFTLISRGLNDLLKIFCHL